MSVKLSFTAAGDAIIQRPIQEGFAGFTELTPFILRGDARFFNLETTLNREGDAYGSQFSGGTYIRTNPEVLDGLMELGFNMTSFNNNHVLDFGYPGMLQTLDYVKESGLVHAGVGRNLAEASAPVISKPRTAELRSLRSTPPLTPPVWQASRPSVAPVAPASTASAYRRSSP